MPIYSYKCEKCGQIFDKLQKPGSNGHAECDMCGAEAVRIYSPVGIIFKGSGFYKTDYGSTSKSSVTAGSKTKKQEKTQNTKTESKDSKKVEAKADKSS